MGINVKINLNDCYRIETIKEDYTVSKFDTTVKHGKHIPMGVFINEQPHFLMPDVHNLSFGRISADNTLINDSDKLYHQNHSKVFSTVVLAAYTFLTENKSKFVGIDGSSNSRAYMYYRCILNNLDNLNNIFTIHGVNYYVRILRKLQDDDERYPLDVDDQISMLKDINKPLKIAYDKLHNYFIFKLK